MKPLYQLNVVSVAAAIAAGCVHTPPGTSVEIALAMKAQLIRLPAAAESLKVAHAGNVQVPPVEPELPLMDDRIEGEAEAFTRGKFAMADGQDVEAIKAFEEAVRIDATRLEAWQNLAMLYEKTGAEKKALAAFRKSKAVAKQ